MKANKPSKRFVERVNNISSLVNSETLMQTSSLKYFKDSATEALINQKVKQLQAHKCMTETDEIVTKADIETAAKGLDNADKKPTKQQLQFVKDNEERVGMPKLKETRDDGYEVLSADEYIAVRTKPALEKLKEQLPPISRRKTFLQALTYVATGVSVMLGTLHMDIYIAISTAIVSLMTGILEYQKLEATIISMNNSSSVL